jgi:3-oxoacyl-[acyl-carrier-protein] synthase-3
MTINSQLLDFRSPEIYASSKGERARREKRLAKCRIPGVNFRGMVSAVPSRQFDNLTDASGFTDVEVRKVVGMAGVKKRRLAGESVCSSDLCQAAAESLLDKVGWDRGSVDALIMVTQSPDYFLPSTACLLQMKLGLPDTCATFDVGLGCSGYPYGLYLGALMLHGGGIKRALVLHGETPARFADESDRSVSLLFGDAGSATALEADGSGGDPVLWSFVLHTDGSGYEDLIIPGGGFRERFPTDKRRHCVSMNGANIFNFSIKRVPQIIQDTLDLTEMKKEDVDYFILHQSNQFIMRHLSKKMGIPDAKVPLTLGDFGNTGGPSIPLTLANGGLVRPSDRRLQLMLVGYGVGLSWASALIPLTPDAVLGHVEFENRP